MRVRSTYVLTPALLAAALGAPFALPRLLDRHGSAEVALRAVAPPAAAPVVVQMAALARPKAVVRAQHVLVRATPRLSVGHAELASVRVHPARSAAVTHPRPIRHHSPTAEESRRAPDPAPAATPTVVPLTPQPVNLNSTDVAAAPAPAPAAPAPAPAPVQLQPTPVADSGSGSDDQGHGNGNGEGHGRGHGHDH
jgi:hypothetical protein